jgi:hypothetical protein
MSDSESELDQEEIAENLMNVELDNECQIMEIIKMPIYEECIHADSVLFESSNCDNIQLSENQVRCPRCELVVKVIDQKMPQNEAKKLKFDESYVQSSENLKRLKSMILFFAKK